MESNQPAWVPHWSLNQSQLPGDQRTLIGQQGPVSNLGQLPYRDGVSVLGLPGPMPIPDASHLV